MILISGVLILTLWSSVPASAGAIPCPPMLPASCPSDEALFILPLEFVPPPPVSDIPFVGSIAPPLYFVSPPLAFFPPPPLSDILSGGFIAPPLGFVPPPPVWELPLASPAEFPTSNNPEPATFLLLGAGLAGLGLLKRRLG